MAPSKKLSSRMGMSGLRIITLIRHSKIQKHIVSTSEPIYEGPISLGSLGPTHAERQGGDRTTFGAHDD